MSTIKLAENQRRMMGGSTDPAALRLRMIEADDTDDDTDMTDAQMLEALQNMSDADRQLALEILPDADIARLYGEMDHDDD